MGVEELAIRVMVEVKTQSAEKITVQNLSHIFFRGTDVPAPMLLIAPKMAPLLQIQPQPTAQPGLTAPAAKIALDPFLVWLLGEHGLSAEMYRAGVLQRRLPACLRQLRVTSTTAARQLLERKPHFRARALSALLIGVSEFFRDTGAFDALRHTFLPRLLQARGPVRALSLGVSQGQELYSIALLLAEAGILGASELRGIDCRRDALDHARFGLFEDKEVASIDPELRKRYFIRHPDRWQVVPAVRDRIHWSLGDVLAWQEPALWDMILFRNVAIYMEPQAVQPVWARIAAQLCEGGLLVTGKAERPPQGLPFIREAACIYRRSSNS
jgi:chemotaxis methyl-accepting protein methylase